MRSVMSRRVRTAAAAGAALALAAALAAACAGTVSAAPARTAAPAAAARAAASTYTVKPGDSLTAIAARYGTTLAALARLNRLDPARPLLIGTTLKLPAAWCPGLTLKVQAGDSLWTMAERYGLSRTRLAAVNGLKADALLLLGSTLKIPSRPCAEGATGTTAAGSTATAAAGTTPTRTAPAPVVEQGPALTGSKLAVLQGKLAAAAKDPALDPALTGVAVIDLRSGATVFAQNADTPLRPASTEKVPLLVAALKLLGPSFRTRTDVLTTAPVVGGVLKGDIVLKGYGDARLSVADVAQLAGVVRSLGITSVTGGVVADESAFDTQREAPGWKPGFVGEETPPLSALVIDGLAGPEGPAASAAIIFTKALQGAGVAVAGPGKVGTAGAGARVLASRNGPLLRELATAMGTFSDNYVAETTLKLLGLRVGGAGTSAAGASVVMQRVAALGVPRNGLVIADGSGLSSLDRMAARTLAGLLAAAARDPEIAPALKESLALGGVSGTLVRRLKSGAAAGVVRAKTGTTDQSSALAGYVGDRYAFAVISNSGSLVDSWAAHALQDRVVETLAESLR